MIFLMVLFCKQGWLCFVVEDEKDILIKHKLFLQSKINTILTC